MIDAAVKFFIRRLKEHGVTVYECVTSPETTRDNIRRGIVAGQLDATIIGSKDGKPETYAQLFERVWQQPLFAQHIPRKSA